MKRLSIVVPVYNEGHHLDAVVRKLFTAPIPEGVEAEWIFVDDCSTDSSRTVLEGLAGVFPFKLLVNPSNSGKGASVARGVREASGDFILIQDADFEYDPADIPELMRPLLNDEADAVFGSRFKKSAQQVHRTYHYLINKLLTLLSNLASGIYVSDMETCYKAMRADLFKAMNLRSKRFGIEVEITAYLAKARVRLVEVPIRYYPRTRFQGKKINWRDGVAALSHIVKFNFRVDLDGAFTNLPERYR